MRTITARRSLSPRSLTRSNQQRPLRFACRLAIFRELGGESGLPRSQSCRRNKIRAPVRLAPASPPVALTTTCPYSAKRQPATYFWFEPNSSFGSSALTRVVQRFTYVTLAE